MRLSALAALAAAGALLAPAAVAASTTDGVIVERVRRMLLVRAGDRLEVFSIVPGATLVDFGDPGELMLGERIRVDWSRERSGVKLAETITVSPFALPTPEFNTATTELAAHLERPGGSSALVLDARPSAAFAEGHISGARSVPVARAGAELAAALPQSRDQVVVVYGESLRSREGVDLLRQVVARGYVNAKLLQGGLRAWVDDGRARELAPEALARMLGRERLAVLDVRERDRVRLGTVRGAVSIPRSELNWRELSDGEWLPTIVVVGEDAADPSAREVAEQIRRAQPQANMTRYPTLYVLDGGWRAWSSRGLPSSRGEAIPAKLSFRRPQSEIDPAEFAKLYRAEGPRGSPLLLDVRPGGASPPWTKKIVLEELAGNLRELPRDREIVTFCDFGRQSAIAQAILERNGFRARYLKSKLPE